MSVFFRPLQRAVALKVLEKPAGDLTQPNKPLQSNTELEHSFGSCPLTPGLLYLAMSCYTAHKTTDPRAIPRSLVSGWGSPRAEANSLKYRLTKVQWQNV